MADLAKVYLQAQDMSGAAFDSFKRNMQGVNSDVDKLKGTLAGLGVAVSVGGFALLIKNSIDALDRLNDLNKTTDITVERLSGLSLAAKQSGGDLESIASGINKLSQNIGKDSEKFRALGITAKEPLEAFKQLADIYTQLEEPQERAAVMAAALGKSWAGAAPLLAEGSSKIQEMVDKGAALSGVTKDMTEQADALNDKWAELTGTGGMLNRQVGPLLPLLNAMADDLLEVQKNSTGAAGGTSLLAEALRAITVLGGNVKYVLSGVGTELGGLTAQLVGFASAQQKILRGDIRGGLEEANAAWRVGDLMKSDAAKARTDFDAWEKRMMTVGLLDTKRDNWDMMGNPAAARARADASARAKEFLKEPKTLKEKDSGFDALMDGLRQKLDLDKQSTELEKINFELTKKKYDLIGEGQREELRGIALLLDAKNAEKAVNAAALKHAEDMIKAEEERNKQITDFNQSWSEYRQNLEFETRIMGMTETQRATEIAMRKLKLDYQRASAGLTGEEFDALTAIYELEKDRLPEIIAQNEARREGLATFRDLWSTVERTGKDVFINIFSSGKSAFEGIGKAIKASVIDLLYQITVRKWMINIGTTISGSIGAAGAAGAATGGGGAGGFGLGDILSLGNSASNLMGGGVTAGILGSTAAYSTALGIGGGVGSQAAMLAAQTGVFGGSGLAMTAAAGGEAAMAAGITAIPYIGWAIAAVMLIASLTKNKKIPATHLGDATGIFGADGMVDRSQWGPGDNSGARSVIDSMFSRFDAIATALGARYSSTTFAYGANTGGQGENPNFVVAGGSYRAGEMFGSFTPLNQENIDLHTSRAVLSALQESTLPNYMRRFFDSLVPATMDQTAITNALNFASTLKQVRDSLFETKKPLELMQDNLLKMFDAMHTSAGKFKDDFKSALREGLTPETLAAWQALGAAVSQFTERRAAIEGQLSALRTTLPEQLGINALTQFQDSLAVSEYLSPLDRLTAARGQLTDIYGRAMGGDIGAVQGFAGIAQATLGIGREAYASGPEFAALFKEVNRELNDVLGKQQNIANDILKTLPVAITQGANDTVAALNKQTKALVDELRAVKSELKKMAP